MRKEEIYAIRGATTVEADFPVEIDEAVKELYEEILKENNLTEDEIAFIHFSQTSDLKTRNSAAALRKAGYASNVPLFCTQEAEISGMMPKVIRVLILVNHKREKEVVMIYQNRAKALRPDITD